MSENKHPYIPSPGVLIKTFEQFRKTFPSKVDSSTLKKLSLAPNNEGMVIATLRFLGLIDEEGNKLDLGKKLFLTHDDSEFAKSLEKIVSDKYNGLFDLKGNESWDLDRNTLIGYFRTSDSTSSLTATRQAIAFETLSSLSGHSIGSRPSSNMSKPKVNTDNSVKIKKESKPKTFVKNPDFTGSPKVFNNGQDIGLTVRIEINLPAQGDQETYDRIFTSIKKNLLNG